jgi:hypothetical protein
MHKHVVKPKMSVVIWTTGRSRKLLQLCCYGMWIKLRREAPRTRHRLIKYNGHIT